MSNQAIKQFKPFGNDSQETTIGSEETGEIVFSNDFDEIVISGQLTIPKGEKGAKYATSLIEMLTAIRDAAAVPNTTKKAGLK